MIQAVTDGLVCRPNPVKDLLASQRVMLCEKRLRCGGNHLPHVPLRLDDLRGRNADHGEDKRDGHTGAIFAHRATHHNPSYQGTRDGIENLHDGWLAVVQDAQVEPRVLRAPRSVTKHKYYIVLVYWDVNDHGVVQTQIFELLLFVMSKINFYQRVLDCRAKAGRYAPCATKQYSPAYASHIVRDINLQQIV